MLKKWFHSPAHLYMDNTPYFITSAIYQKRHLLASPVIKEYLLDTIISCLNARNWQLNDWVILDNHYHLLAVSDKGEDLSRIFREIHGKSARFIQKEIACELPIWWNYWDYCPRDEQDYFVRLNYLFNNPIKHGYVHNLQDYAFSSFHHYFNKFGREVLANQFKKYSDYKILNLSEDDF